MMGLRTLLDLVYPRPCLGCNGPVGPDHAHVCWDCLSQVQYIAHPYCAICGDPVEGRVDDAFVCYTCADARPHFELARSAARYRGILQTVLRSFKYRTSFWAAPDLVKLLTACARAHYEVEEIDAVTCVPLYPARQRMRGFNQAGILARGLARGIGKPFLPGALVRVKPTPTQTNLTARDRATNVRAAFRTRQRRRIEGRRLLLVDDVMTTGATVNECARTLKEGGAAVVLVATVARG